MRMEAPESEAGLSAVPVADIRLGAGIGALSIIQLAPLVVMQIDSQVEAGDGVMLQRADRICCPQL